MSFEFPLGPAFNPLVATPYFQVELEGKIAPENPRFITTESGLILTTESGKLLTTEG